MATEEPISWFWYTFDTFQRYFRNSLSSLIESILFAPDIEVDELSASDADVHEEESDELETNLNAAHIPSHPPEGPDVAWKVNYAPLNCSDERGDVRDDKYSLDHVFFETFVKLFVDSMGQRYVFICEDYFIDSHKYRMMDAEYPASCRWCLLRFSLDGFYFQCCGGVSFHRYTLKLARYLKNQRECYIRWVLQNTKLPEEIKHIIAEF